METFIETAEFPIALNMAAPALYIAIKGIAAVTIIRYINASSCTSGVIEPNTTSSIKLCNKYITTIIKSDTTNINTKSWSADLQALSFLPLPIYCPETTAPPVARAIKIFIISRFTVSTSDTPETAFSPAAETIIVSAIPTSMVKSCSRTSGKISCLLLNK